MKRLLLPLAFISTTAEAKDAGANAQLVTEHCDVYVNAATIGKQASKFNSAVGEAMDVTGDETNDFEKQSALDYLEEVNAIPYAKIKASFEKLQKTTLLEDESSITEARKELKTLKDELAKADKLLDKHTVLNDGGSYDVAYFTPNPRDVKKASMDKAFADAKKRGIDCGEEVKDYVLTNDKFPGAGEVVETLMKVAGADVNTAILPEVDAFDGNEKGSDLKTEKANFVKESAEFEKALLLSKARALRVKSFIQEIYLKTNK